MAYQESYSLSSGPDNGTVLYLQHQQRFTVIWKGYDLGILRIGHHCHMMGWKLHQCIIPYIINAGLYDVAHLGTIAIDHALLIALVER